MACSIKRGRGSLFGTCNDHRRAVCRLRLRRRWVLGQVGVLRQQRARWKQVAEGFDCERPRLPRSVLLLDSPDSTADLRPKRSAEMGEPLQAEAGESGYRFECELKVADALSDDVGERPLSVFSYEASN